MSGKEIAETMLRESGIYDVRVVSVEGRLTDHYNPQDKTVNLSPDVYYGRSVAAAAVASMNAGTRVQHADCVQLAAIPVANGTVPEHCLSVHAMDHPDRCSTHQYFYHPTRDWCSAVRSNDIVQLYHVAG